MAQTGPAQSHIVELKAVEPGYPFYGALVTEPARPLETLIGGGRALVHDSLLARFGLRLGDRFRVGDLELTIAGVIQKEPDRAIGVFSLGPRVLIAGDDLERTGLIRPGSRVRYRTLVRLPEGRDAQAFRDRLAAALPAGQRVSTYGQAQPGLRRFWDQLTMYLGLTGLVALMVGGIGVAVSVNAFVRQKLASIAILKALGAGWRPLLTAYLLQTALLGLGGSALGALLGSAVQPLLAPTLTRLLPIELTLSFSLRAVLSGLAMGVGVTLLYALWPLLQIRHVRPASHPANRRRAAAARPPAVGHRPPARGRPRRARALAGRLLEDRRPVRGGPRRRPAPPRPRRPPRHRAGPPRALAVAGLAAGRGQSPPPRQPRGPRAGLARPGRDAGRLHRPARPEPARRARGPRPRQRARVLLHRHPDRPGRAVRAARGGPRRERARRADPGGALAPGRGQRAPRSKSAPDGKTRGISRASTC